MNHRKYQRNMPDDVRKALNVICFYRKVNNFFLREIAECLKVHFTTLSNWERGKHVPDAYYHDRIREYAREIVQYE